MENTLRSILAIKTRNLDQLCWNFKKFTCTRLQY